MKVIVIEIETDKVILEGDISTYFRKEDYENYDAEAPKFLLVSGATQVNIEGSKWFIHEKSPWIDNCFYIKVSKVAPQDMFPKFDIWDDAEIKEAVDLFKAECEYQRLSKEREDFLKTGSSNE